MEKRKNRKLQFKVFLVKSAHHPNYFVHGVLIVVIKQQRHHSVRVHSWLILKNVRKRAESKRRLRIPRVPGAKRCSQLQTKKTSFKLTNQQKQNNFERKVFGKQFLLLRKRYPKCYLRIWNEVWMLLSHTSKLVNTLW